jgi:hypothetical protein
MTTDKRKRGGQPKNQNALKHGRHSTPLRAARRAAVLAAAEEKRVSDARWAEQMPRIDYAAIIECIRKS